VTPPHAGTEPGRKTVLRQTVHSAVNQLRELTTFKSTI
jgi:hypothetical protein